MQALWSWSGLSDLAVFAILFGLIVTSHHYSEAYRDLAGALATLGQTGEALAILERYRDRHPEDPCRGGPRTGHPDGRGCR